MGRKNRGRKRRDDFQRMELLRPNRHGELANAIGSIAACLATVLGAIMLILGYTRGDRCKMRAIDATSWTNNDLDGNLIKWFKYTGTLLIISGILANFTIGACPATLRSCCRGVGAAISDLMAGVFGKMVLFIMYLIVLLCNLLGYFWLTLASRARTPDNSELEGAINYCAPEIWYTAHFVVNSFWAMTLFGTLVTCAQVHRFFRGEEARWKPVVLGKKPKDAPSPPLGGYKV